VRNAVVTILLVVSGLIGADLAAQQADGVPDQMPFDVPYGPAITANQAAEVVAAVVTEAQQSPRNWKLANAVVDPNGDLVYFYRMDQTQVGSTNVALGKARTAARFRRPTRAFFEGMQTAAGSFIPTLDSGIVASPGGFPLFEDGRLVGALGCSGGASSQDEAACAAGAATMSQ